jgi:hypothetical protein
MYNMIKNGTNWIWKNVIIEKSHKTANFVWYIYIYIIWEHLRIYTYIYIQGDQKISVHLTCNLYCNHQVHREFWSPCIYMYLLKCSYMKLFCTWLINKTATLTSLLTLVLICLLHRRTNRQDRAKMFTHLKQDRKWRILWRVQAHFAKSLSGAFTKLRKANISFAISVCPSVRMEQLGAHWKDFHAILNLSAFRKFIVKILSFVKIWQEWRMLYTMTRAHLLTTRRPVLLRMRNVLDKRRREILCSITFSENCTCYEIVWKNCGSAGQATHGNIKGHTRFDCWITKATKHTPRTCTTLLFPRQRRLHERAHVTLYVHCLSCCPFQMAYRCSVHVWV